MTLEYSIRLLAGSLVIFSLVMSQLFSPWWLLLTLFVGLNLVQSSFTGICPAEKIIKKLFFQKETSS
jgi:hypothetical protein